MLIHNKCCMHEYKKITPFGPLLLRFAHAQNAFLIDFNLSRLSFILVRSYLLSRLC